MTNKEVIEKFLKGEKKGSTPLRTIRGEYTETKGKTLIIRECYKYTVLINYETPIAFLKKNKNKLTINTTKWGSTTSKIQNAIKEMATRYGYDITEVQPAQSLDFTETLTALM